MNNIKYYTLLIGILGFFPCLAMQTNKNANPEVEAEEKTFIEFRKEKKLPLEWVIECFRNKEHPFSITRVLRYYPDSFLRKEGYLEYGDVLSLQKYKYKAEATVDDLEDKELIEALEEESVEDIKTSNFVYCPFYTLDKTRLNPTRFDNVGAIILGTTKESACREATLLKLANKLQ